MPTAAAVSVAALGSRPVVDSTPKVPPHRLDDLNPPSAYFEGYLAKPQELKGWNSLVEMASVLLRANGQGCIQNLSRPDNNLVPSKSGRDPGRFALRSAWHETP